MLPLWTEYLNTDRGRGVKTARRINGEPVGSSAFKFPEDPAITDSPIRLDVDRQLKRALEALARVLSGPAVNRYRVASTSQPGVGYVITADGTDVTCSCPGFEYRGQCRHARDVKASLAAGKAVPAAYVLEGAV